MGIFSKKTTKEETTPVAKPAAAPKTVANKTAVKPASMKDLYATTGAKSKVVKKEGDQTVVKKVGYNQAYRILLRPLITEKGSDLNALNKYMFEVAYEANKIEIAKAILEVYGVMPSKVNLMRMEGKIVRRGRVTGQRKNWKKAIVTLPAGKTINVYEGV